MELADTLSDHLFHLESQPAMESGRIQSWEFSLSDWAIFYPLSWQLAVSLFALRLLARVVCKWLIVHMDEHATLCYLVSLAATDRWYLWVQFRELRNGQSSSGGQICTDLSRNSLTDTRNENRYLLYSDSNWCNRNLQISLNLSHPNKAECSDAMISCSHLRQFL